MTTNNKPAHTPSPWVWEQRYTLNGDEVNRDWNSEDFQAGRIKLVSEADGSTVLEEWAEYAADSGLIVSYADAKLIAAAPLMAEALKGLIEYTIYLEILTDNSVSSGHNDPLSKIADALRPHCKPLA